MDEILRVTVLGAVAGLVGGGLAILLGKLGKTVLHNWGIKDVKRVETWSVWVALIFLLFVVIVFVIIRNR